MYFILNLYYYFFHKNDNKNENKNDNKNENINESLYDYWIY